MATTDMLGQLPWLSQVMLPLLTMWKVRLPLVGLPVLLGLRRLAHGSMVSPVPDIWGRDVTLLFAISLGTGFFHLPFSVTWWFILIVAFTLETKLLIGVSTVLSLTCLLSWYGSRLRHPHMICALWQCRMGKMAGSAGNIPLVFWQFWDLAVHATPAVLMLFWHGPGITWEGGFEGGMVSSAAVAMALPLTMVWFFGLMIGVGKSFHLVQLADTNVVYQITPNLPESCWRWIYGSHLTACSLWLVMLTVPSGAPRCVVSLPILAAWLLVAKSHFREDLLLGRFTFFLVAHLLAVWGAVKASGHPSAVRLLLEVVLSWQLGALGITVGAHRLWSHRSFVAKLPFRMFLMLLNSFANQGTIYHWARDHRAHHKWTDTDADPHNTTRGFFYAHIGWLLVPKTEELRSKGNSIPCADLLADPVVALQKWADERFMFMSLVSFGLPAIYGRVVFGDAFLGFLVHGVLRWTILLHATWCVNSWAHYFGEQEHDHSASARQSLFTSLGAAGEGWHSYHHKFPWDYATSEYGVHRQWNPSKLLIDVAAALGQVTSVKRADHLARKQREANRQ